MNTSADQMPEPAEAGAPPPQGQSVRMHAVEAQRVRILWAAVRVASEHGADGVTASRVIEQAGVSRRTFYDLFSDRADCLRAATEHVVQLAGARAAAAYAAEIRWRDGLRAGLYALLEFFEQEPALARLCVVGTTPAGTAALKRRQEVLDRLARVLDAGRTPVPSPREMPPLTAEALVGGALAIVQARLLAAEPPPLTDLLNPLMSVILQPYLGRRVALSELRRPTPARLPPTTVPPPNFDLLEGLDIRLTYRTLRVLSVIQAEPGLNNVEVGQRAGITDQGQTSKLLARLSRLELVRNEGDGQPKGAANAWHLTSLGAALEQITTRSTLAGGSDGR
jgi:AcrR family transcriptional regulator